DGRGCYAPPLTTLAQVELESSILAASKEMIETIDATISRQDGMHDSKYEEGKIVADGGYDTSWE
ncbi:MAG: hypothetical protein HUJ98_12910, partial [Bacteroidaceae bacterium]|nr:hypothetical protein [Bacteroidaceae bacterium]